MPTLKDVITDSYDIYLKGDKYFCVPKYGTIQEGFNYEMRDVTELDSKIDNHRRALENNMIVTVSTAVFDMSST